MMRRLLLMALALVVLASTGACGGADDGAGAPDTLVVSGVWARSTPPGAEDGVAYLTIVSPVDDRLLGASVPTTVAADAAVHESMLLDDGTDAAESGGGHHHGGGDAGPSGETVETTVELPAGEPVDFAPGGRHVMLIGLAAPLRSGDRIPITLELEGAGEVVVEAQVAANAP